MDSNELIKTYNNKHELAKELDCNVKYITRVLSGDRESYKGLWIRFHSQTS